MSLLDWKPQTTPGIELISGEWVDGSALHRRNQYTLALLGFKSSSLALMAVWVEFQATSVATDAAPVRVRKLRRLIPFAGPELPDPDSNA